MDPNALRFLGLGQSLDDPPLLLSKRVLSELEPPVALKFQPTSTPLEHASSPVGLKLRLCTWNVLAPSYALHKSFPDVNPDYLKTLHRQPILNRVISDLKADAICLQEVEDAEQWKVHLQGLGYDMAFAKRPGRADGCLIGWLPTLRFKDQLVVNFDDCLLQNVPSSVSARFARKNIALVVELEDMEKNSFLLATTHLYWGSEHEDVRLWQLQVLLESTANHFGTNKPLALCGDLNMLPWGSGYKLLQTGRLEVPKKFRQVERFLVDRDISKAAKPLRLLGLDVSVETWEEREQRPEASQGLRTAKVPLVARAAREARVLVSASRRLVSRADAALAYFIDARQFDTSLAKLCIDLAVDLSPERFYTRCVKCNGRVIPLANNEKEQDRARAFGAPESGIPLFTCTSCGQIYWFSRDEGSASARARLQVDNLVKLVDKTMQEEGMASCQQSGEELLMASACFLRDGGGCLEHMWQLRSAYEEVEPRERNQVHESVSNSKYGFHGCIDYIWLSPHFHPHQRLQLPTVADLNQEPGKTLPSMVSRGWPSDHWPLAVDVTLEHLDV